MNEGGAEFVSEGQESFDEIVGGPIAVVEATEVGDDLGKLGAKREALWHRCRPFGHAVGRVDAVVGGVEFQGPKLPTVVRRPRALRVLFRLHRPAPVSDGPHRAPGPHRRRAFLLASGNNVGKSEAGRWRGVGPIQAFRCGIEFAKLHPPKLQRTTSAKHVQALANLATRFRIQRGSSLHELGVGLGALLVVRGPAGAQ